MTDKTEMPMEIWMDIVRYEKEPYWEFNGSKDEFTGGTKYLRTSPDTVQINREDVEKVIAHIQHAGNLTESKAAIYSIGHALTILSAAMKGGIDDSKIR